MNGVPGALKEGLKTFGLTGGQWWMFVIYFSTVHPFLEELLWRPRVAGDEGGSLSGLRHGLFAGYHLLVLYFFIGTPWLLLVLVVLTTVSVIWAKIARRQGGALLPLLSHALADLSVMVAVSLLICNE